MRQAAGEVASPLDVRLRARFSNELGMDVDAVRVHEGPASEAASAALGARAFTLGRDVFVGREGRTLNELERNHLLAHEATHAAQQGFARVGLQGTLPVQCPNHPAEEQANCIASAMAPGAADARRLAGSTGIHAITPSVQRDITGSKTWSHGELKIDFKKKDATAPGDSALEHGAITFTPTATAPESKSIRFIQVLRTIDTATAAGSYFNYSGGLMAPLNSMRTKADPAKNVAGGFFVDQHPWVLNVRTTKADPTVLPYYDASGYPDPANVIGKRDGSTIEAAVLQDTVVSVPENLATPVPENLAT